MASLTKLRTTPAKNAHLVQQAFAEAQKKYGRHWHLLSPGIREALIRAEAFNVIVRQVESAEVDTWVQFAHAVVRELGAREEE
jgi:hypothetical protein